MHFLVDGKPVSREQYVEAWRREALRVGAYTRPRIPRTGFSLTKLGDTWFMVLPDEFPLELLFSADASHTAYVRKHRGAIVMEEVSDE